MEKVLDNHWLWAVIIDCNCKGVTINPIIQSRNPLLLVTQTPNMWQYFHSCTKFRHLLINKMNGRHKQSFRSLALNLTSKQMPHALNLQSCSKFNRPFIDKINSSCIHYIRRRQLKSSAVIGRYLITPSLLVRKRTIPTERPPLVGQVSANFCGQRVSRGQRNGSLRPLIRFSRPQ
jgi:hypothetical protein